MKETGINMERVKINNRRSILQLLNNEGAMSRKDIASRLKLTPAAVTLMCTQMIENGLIVEKGEVEEQRRAGRKKVLVDIDYTYKYILGINIEPDLSCFTITDLKGSIIASSIIKTNNEISPKDFILQIVDKCKIMMWEKNINKSNILGVGVGITGVVDRKEGISRYAYGIWKEEVDVKSIIEAELELPVVVENNVKAFAEGEHIFGIGRKYDNILFIKWGPGVGSTILIDGKIYQGKDHKAAEIGHYIVDVNGKQCKCGRRGCLETKVSFESIIESIGEIFSEENTPDLYERIDGVLENISMEKIDILNEVSDKAVINIINEDIKTLALAVLNEITILYPGKVVVYGEMFENKKTLQKFMDYCSGFDSTYDDSYILKSKLNDKIYYIGPVALVIQELFWDKGGM